MVVAWEARVPDKAQRVLQFRPVHLPEQRYVSQGGLIADQSQQGQTQYRLKRVPYSPGLPRVCGQSEIKGV